MHMRHQWVTQVPRQFESNFVDDRTGVTYTTTFWQGEPVLYHPPNLPKPVFMHIELVAQDHFVVGNSTTGTRYPLVRHSACLR